MKLKYSNLKLYNYKYYQFNQNITYYAFKHHLYSMKNIKYRNMQFIQKMTKYAK